MKTFSGNPLDDPDPSASPQRWQAYKQALKALTPAQRAARHQQRRAEMGESAYRALNERKPK